MPVIKIDPVPASRPRVMKNGITFYAEPYKSFKKILKAEIEKLPARGNIVESEVGLVAVFRVKRPKSTKLNVPRPDIDNYVKALMDALNGVVLVDDRQIVSLSATKMWADPGEEGSIDFSIVPPGQM